MKNIPFICIFIVAVFANSCDRILKNDSVSTEKDTILDEQTMVGGDKDEHGCIGSAGYVWSELLGSCIRVFERGYRLNNVSLDDESENRSAFVLFDESQSRAEIYLPDLDKSIILEKTSEFQYNSKDYEFNEKTFSLKIKGVLVYQAAQIELKDIDELDELYD